MVFIILHDWWIGPPILVMCTEEEEDIVAEDIDGEEVLIRSIVAGKKCVLVVNVAT